MPRAVAQIGAGIVDVVALAIARVIGEVPFNNRLEAFVRLVVASDGYCVSSRVRYQSRWICICIGNDSTLSDRRSVSSTSNLAIASQGGIGIVIGSHPVLSIVRRSIWVGLYDDAVSLTDCNIEGGSVVRHDGDKVSRNDLHVVSIDGELKVKICAAIDNSNEIFLALMK